MMGKVIMAYGDFKFRIAETAYSEFSSKIDFKWASIERLGQRPKLFFEGIGDETITLSIEIVLTDSVDPDEALSQLKEIGLRGKPEPIADALGNVFGNWVMTDLSRNNKFVREDGKARYVEASMGLKYYA